MQNLSVLSSLSLVALLFSSVAHANENLASQLDIVAPLVNAGTLDELGGPDDAAGLVETIDGRWFTLDNTARNWEGSAVSSDALARAVERLCADDWENIVTMTKTGGDRFVTEQRTPDGADNGTFELIATDAADRRFTMALEDNYILAIYGLETAPEAKQQEALAEFAEIVEQGAQIWRPTPDLMVNHTPIETEVWGRCPS